MSGLPGGRGALADGDSFAMVLSSLMGFLSPVSLICSGRASGLAAAGKGFESLQPHCQPVGSAGAPLGEVESREDVLLGDFPLGCGRAGNLREKGQEL